MHKIYLTCLTCKKYFSQYTDGIHFSKYCEKCKKEKTPLETHLKNLKELSLEERVTLLEAELFNNQK